MLMICDFTSTVKRACRGSNNDDDEDDDEKVWSKMSE